MDKNDTTLTENPNEGPLKRLKLWISFRGDRIALTAGAIAAVFVLVRVLIWVDAIAVGANSYMALLFSGVVAGLLTLITVALTINQLILSRVFGTPQELSGKLEASRQFRNSIAELADRNTVPIEPADFISLIGETLHKRTTSLQEAIYEADGRQDTSEQLSGILSEADTLRNIDAEQMRDIDIIEIIIGSRHAQNISAADGLRGTRADQLSEDGQNDLDAVVDLLEALSVAQQHYKTLLLQQTLAQLSRYITYFGAIAIVVAALVPLVYRSMASPMLASQYLPWVASAGIAISIAPLAVFLAYILRLSIVAQYTLSVGAFVPPAEKAQDE